MVQPTGSIRDVLIGWKEQAIWLTAETAVFNQVDVEPTQFVAQTARRDGKQAIGARIKSNVDIELVSKGTLPELSLSGTAKKEELADMLYSIFQEVVEDMTTPFKKTYNLHASQPIFDADDGYFRTVGIVYPTAAQHHSVRSMISKQLTLTCKPSENAGFMNFNETLVGIGPVNIADTLVTSGWLRKPHALFQFFDLARGTTNFDGGGDTNIEFKDGFEIEMTWGQSSGAGQDATNNQYESIIISDVSIIVRLMVGKGATWQSARAAINDDSINTLVGNLAFGGPTPGDADGDLDFTFNGKVVSAEPDNEEHLGGTIEIECTENGAVEAMTVILVDAVDRSWPG